jgi:deazaflavin-dependent oxidoreductase (nitroreductase family)
MTSDMSLEDSTRARLARVAKAGTTVITHYGRKTGRPYKVRIWFTSDGEHVYLQTMNMGRQWPRNVRANPKISLRIRDQEFEGEASWVEDPGEMSKLLGLLKRKYPIARPYLWIKKTLPGAFRVRITR